MCTEVEGRVKRDKEIIKDLLDWYFKKIVKEDKVMRKFKKEVLPILMEDMNIRVQWDKLDKKGDENEL